MKDVIVLNEWTKKSIINLIDTSFEQILEVYNRGYSGKNHDEFSLDRLKFWGVIKAYKTANILTPSEYIFLFDCISFIADSFFSIDDKEMKL